MALEGIRYLGLELEVVMDRGGGRVWVGLGLGSVRALGTWPESQCPTQGSRPQPLLQDCLQSSTQPSKTGNHPEMHPGSTLSYRNPLLLKTWSCLKFALGNRTSPGLQTSPPATGHVTRVLAQ